MSGAWSQLEQLLTCAICLDRFRNPKLLPCQHTFCGEPCMEGLVDYARRQIKCPECRAEHRIPYNGVQSFPNNVTLTRFLDLHRSITGEEPEPLPSQMDRCGVCGEKSHCMLCAHCSKKVCDECHQAHLDILRREINRINSQIRRGLDKLNEHVEQSDKGNEKLLTITTQIRDEITESVRRLIKDLKDRETKLLEELDEFLINETKNCVKLKEDFEIELATITSNSDMADENIIDTYEWTDNELMEFKDIFMKTLDFLRNLDTDSMDYSRKIKYIQKVDLDNIRRNVSDFGEIRIQQPLSSSSSSTTGNYLSPLSPADSMSNLSLPQSSLMRSQSDHRLAQFGNPSSPSSTTRTSTQRSDQLQRSYLDITGGSNKYGGGSDSERERCTSPTSGRRIEGSVRFGSVHERSSTARNNNDFGYTRGWQRPGDQDYEPSNSANFRSRFMRERIRERTGGIGDDHNLDDHDSSDILSGHRVRFQEESSSTTSTTATAATKSKLFDTEEMINMRTPLSGLIKLLDSPHLMERLHQNEIKAKQKAAEQKENETSSSSTANNITPVISNPITPTPTPVHRPATRQMSEDEIEKQKKQNQAAFTQQQQPIITTANNMTTTTTTTTTTTNRSPLLSDSNNNSSNVTTSLQNRRIQSLQQEDKRSPSISDDNSDIDLLNYDDDDDNNNNVTKTTKSTTMTTATRPSTTTTNSTVRRRIYASSGSGGSGNQSTNNFSKSIEYPGESSTTTARNKYSPSSYAGNINNNNNNNSIHHTQAQISSSSSSLLNNNNNNNTYAHYRSNRKISRDEDDLTPTTTTTYSSPLSRRNSVNRRNYHYNDDVITNNINESETYRRSSIHHQPVNDRYGGGSLSTSSSYLRNRLAKSKSSHAVAYDDSDEESNNSGIGNPLSPSASAIGGFKSRFMNYGSSNNNNNSNLETNSDRLTSARRTSRSGYTYRTREPSPEEESAGSVTQYLINKYGTRNNRPSVLSKSKSSHAIFGRSLSSSDEDLPANVTTTKYRRDSSSTTDYTPYKSSSIGLSYPRQMYQQKKRMMMKIGSRGTNPSCFTWPRGVACGPDNGIVVADSSNHRVQVFDSTGRFQFEFGSYGSGEGEFDCLAGVTVNRIGHFIVSDRYNHRVQVFDASGRFLRTFGNEGRSDGKFSYPWGIATDALGFIYVCDKENHRIQVFQSDGTFVGKFGSIGSRAGMLEHPHYIAVSNTNRIVVSDSNNHRIQIFDINGRSTSTFGSEGSGDGQFKFPRGVAVDENGFIIVGDSGNNRIQIFNPDGTFLKTFGQWGSGEGEFKGLEGVAISSTGNILVCDRENHRIQVF
uniref:Probable serine/threonine-protein kinase DDB_G0282963 n=1 Tax=Dermatophagoides pteronyssinus TaxID=6956 RepID=A0A6P6YEU8_DERPT|nr:probable serine/threonine-protein kinase DDB_G0282963 [Dermatophagoides pteronyssinus]